METPSHVQKFIRAKPRVTPYLADMSVLIRNLQTIANSGEILVTTATYVPVNAPNDGAAPIN
ncbi:hypothetical protein O9992_17705 [Vibrio lentus]|nr:hypothetical protein [Vibrio lentus]